MADAWQVGDLALCVRGGLLFGQTQIARSLPKAGVIYEVEKVSVEWFIQGTEKALWLKDGPKQADGSSVWPSFRFRKIRPHTPDEEDAETIRLLNGAPVGEPA